MKKRLILAVGLVAGTSAASGALVTLNSSDGLNASSFNTAGNWSDSQPPSAGNDYVNNVSGRFLRTPANSSSHTFAGDSLTLSNGAILLYKGTGNTGVITVGNLILDGGVLDHRNGSGDLFQLAGGLDVQSGSTVDARQGAIVIASTISGAGSLSFISFQSYATSTITGASGLGGNYNINTGSQGAVTFSATSNVTFTIGASGINNAITSTATPGTVNLNGAFTFDLTGAGTTIGDSWQIVDSGSLTETYGSSFSVTGFTETDNVWTSAIDSGRQYQFEEATGVLSVVVIPEPSAALLGLLGAGLLFRRRR